MDRVVQQMIHGGKGIGIITLCSFIQSCYSYGMIETLLGHSYFDDLEVEVSKDNLSAQTIKLSTLLEQVPPTAKSITKRSIKNIHEKKHGFCHAIPSYQHHV